ncbi:hypothetical protein [Roseiconus lacunae]|uniref:hypothetical protein n=1 Tax=Roseiconus lacunae TaxID=2605694 RepID=UPI001E2D8154|nr:hypothetical protein [Roseiconus lacunae]MCD0459535.1 hypothetical protein [Roseiconus lacunae]
MILRAIPIGEPPSRRYMIRNQHDHSVWDGEKFVEDKSEAMLFATASDACMVMQDILKDFYKGLSSRRVRYVCPVEIEVWGAVTPKQVAHYLHRASVLNVKTQEHGNGPTFDSLVLPTIHWGFLGEVEVSITDPNYKKPDDPAVEWGLEQPDEDE